MSKSSIHSTTYPSIRIEGDFLPADFLQSVVGKEIERLTKGESGSSMLSFNASLQAKWEHARRLWKQKIINADADDDTSANSTRFLKEFFSSVLDFSTLESCAGFPTMERVYPITHHALEGHLPIWISPRPVDSAFSASDHFVGRRSAFSLMQQLVNSPYIHGWGFLADETCIRLIRRNSSLSRRAYLEVNLEQLLKDDGFNDFRAVWILLNSDRFVRHKDLGLKNDWDRWSSKASESGQRIREGMRDGVGRAILKLGRGFLEHVSNSDLRQDIEAGRISTTRYYTEVLRLTYRLIFLLLLEDRDLLHPPRTNRAKRQLYREGYSISCLRDRTLRRSEYDDGHDLWLGLRVVFKALDVGDDSLGLPGLGGLFSGEQCSAIEECLVSNTVLLEAVHELSFFRTGHSLCRVNYRDLDSEEIGSIYDSLLELHPHINIESWIFELVGLEGDNPKGNQRKLTGSYYTPTVLVDALLETTLDLVIKQTIESNPDSPQKALLDLKIIDPSCGSGHFLIAAARRLAAAIEDLSDKNEGDTESMERLHVLRKVVRRCIYGVDLNPMAVELCRTILWMESIVPGMPLPFLESNIRCGDSLTGILDLGELEEGIPHEAYKPHRSDDKAVCKRLIARNKSEAAGYIDLFERPLKESDATNDSKNLADLPEETLEDVGRKARAWRAARRSQALNNICRKGDLLYAAYYAPKTADTEDLIPTCNDLHAIDENRLPRPEVEEFSSQLAKEYSFFHWPYEFSEIMLKGGFDVVLGNPPWEVHTVKEQEYFASRDPQLAALPGAKRKAAIEKLREAGDPIYTEFQSTKRRYDTFNLTVKHSGRFPLVGKGQTNLYQLFSELSLNLYGRRGRAGIIVPTGIATDYGNRFFIRELVDSRRLSSLYDFENKEKLFPIHRSYKFSLMTLARDVDKMVACFYLTEPDQRHDERRQIMFTPEDIALVNPNTRTLPLCRSWMDFQIMKKIYQRWPVLVDESKGEEGNPWGLSFSRLFDMTTDSHLFRTATEMLAKEAKIEGNVFVLPDGDRWLPLYEAKMMHIYDHRWASYEGPKGECVEVPAEQKQDLNYQVMPRYWVPEVEVQAKLKAKGWDKEWLLGYRMISCATNQRTHIPAILPLSGLGNSVSVMFLRGDPSALCGWLACSSSLVTDYLVRTKAGGTNLNFFILRQLPMPAAHDFTPNVLARLVPRVLELAYSSYEMGAFAHDLGYAWAPFSVSADRRRQLQAELDVLIARWYGLSRDELIYILNPKQSHGADWPSETFTALKAAEEREFREYLSQRLVLEAWDRLDAGLEDGTDELKESFSA